ncbi:MAG: type II secretion system protein GspL [Hyphomonas sp.]
MSELYFVWLDAGARDGCLSADASGTVRHCSVKAIGRRDRVVAFVPGTDVAVVPTSLGQRGRKLESAALVYAIEDDIASDAASMHAAIGPEKSEAAGRFVFAAAKSQMADWLDVCRALDAEQVSIVPEQSVMRAGDGMIDLGDRFCAWAEDRPVVIEKAWPSDVHQSLLGQGAPAGGAGADPLEQLARAYLANGGADLATESFACRRRTAFDFSALRLPALLAAALLATLGAESLLSTTAMNRLVPKLEARTTQRLADSNTVTADGGSRSVSGEMRELAAALYGAIAETPGARLKVLRYDASDGSLRATLAFRELGQEQVLRSAVAARGITVVAGDLRTDDAGFVGDIRLGGAA